VAHKKILLVQDDAVEAKAVSEALHGSFRVDWVKHCSEGVERLADSDPYPMRWAR
jgi:PleD family two-component response regulator